MAIFAIGDVHGSIVALKTLFEQHLFSKEDQIFFLGDYVDKGPDSNAVLEYLIEQGKNFNIEFIRGNHDIAMLEARNSEENFLKWYSFDGKSTLTSYNIHSLTGWEKEIPKKHWEFLENTTPYLTRKEFIFVHAGLEPGLPLEEQDDFHLYWKKYEEPEAYSKNHVVVCGHTSRRNGKIAYFGHTVCIDTFAHGGQWLTCYNVKTKEFIKTNNSGEVIEGKL